MSSAFQKASTRFLELGEGRAGRHRAPLGPELVGSGWSPWDTSSLLLSSTRVVDCQREDDVTTAVPPRLPRITQGIHDHSFEGDHGSHPSGSTGAPDPLGARSSGGSPVMAGSLPVLSILTALERASARFQ